MKLINNDSDFKKTFDIFISKNNFSEYIKSIAILIYENELNNKNLEIVISKYKIIKIQNIKNELLDLIILYINVVLDDHIITTEEKNNIEYLKKYFKIKEGDFYKNKYDDIENILNKQFERLYLDNEISREESIFNFNLQDIFDLSYDQIDEFKEKNIKKALERGANIINLDTAKYPKGFNKK